MTSQESPSSASYSAQLLHVVGALASDLGLGPADCSDVLLAGRVLGLGVRVVALEVGARGQFRQDAQALWAGALPGVDDPLRQLEADK